MYQFSIGIIRGRIMHCLSVYTILHIQTNILLFNNLYGRLGKVVTAFYLVYFK